MTNAVATQQPKTFRDLIGSDGYKSQLAAALPRGLTADRMVRVVLTAINRNAKLLDCTKESLWQSVLDAASLGLFPDALGRAYLVPYKDKCQLIIGYKGLIDLMYRSERINMIQTGVVHAGDSWTYQRGMAPRLEHTPRDNPGDWTHVYSIVHLKGCDMPSVEVMTRAEVMAIKRRSRAADSGPWVTDEEAMAIKTCIRRHSKVLPMSAELTAALDVDAQHDPMDATAGPAVPARMADDFGGAKPVEATVREDPPAQAAAAKISDMDLKVAFDRAAAANEAAAAEIVGKIGLKEGRGFAKVPAEIRGELLRALNDLAGMP